MLSGNRKYIPHSQRMKFAEQRILLVGVHLIDREEQRLASAREEPSQLSIRTSDFGPRIDDHNDGRRFLERDSGLAKNLGRTKGFVVGNDAARIHHSKLAPNP